jgi:hypothetical protein
MYSLREHEPAAIRDLPDVIQARHQLAADSQDLRWLRHPRRHWRLMRSYLRTRWDAEQRVRG